MTTKAVALTTLVFGLALVVTAPTASAQLPEGVTFKVLAEFPSDIPGIEKVQLEELTLQPGAKMENITVGNTGY